jgi:ATP-dependent Lon protease
MPDTHSTQFAAELVSLKSQISGAKLPPDLSVKALDMLSRLERMVDTGVYSAEYDRSAHYINWITHLPWGIYTQDKLDITQAASAMNASHYGMIETKDRILEYLATLKLRASQGGETSPRAPAIFLVGLVGTGKTTFAYSLANTLGRKLARIPFGGLGSARDLRGKSRLFAEAEPGAIVKAIRDAGSMNPIILLDEIDRVGVEERADIMGVLVELLDPTQNNRFLDHYLDYPLDLSQVLFVATANNTTNVATAVLDRLEIIQMPSYTDEEKIHISQDFLLPKALKDAGLLASQLTIDPAVWPVVTRPLGYDAGIRTLERTINALTRRVAREVVEGKAETVKINMTNYKQYMKAY